MAKLDFSKFRFRIGDIVYYRGEECTILAYYFSIAFNNFNGRYGYTIKRPRFYHNGDSCSYDENGIKLVNFGHYCWYVIERDVELIKRGKETISTISDFSQAKPGDKVLIKHLDGYDYQFGVAPQMEEMEGQIRVIRTIKKVTPYVNIEHPAHYEIILENDGWSWSDAMLDLIKEDKPDSSTSIKVISKKIGKLFKREEIIVEINVKKKKPKLTFNL